MYRNENPESPEFKVLTYARVSSRHQEDRIDHQLQCIRNCIAAQKPYVENRSQLSQRFQRKSSRWSTRFGKGCRNAVSKQQPSLPNRRQNLAEAIDVIEAKLLDDLLIDSVLGLVIPSD